MKIFIIGGAGYIGSHMVKIAHKAGHEVITLDNLSTGHKWAVKWGPLEVCDITDDSRIKTIIKKYNIDSVIHFAANSYVGESVINPRKYYQNNVLALLLYSLNNNCCIWISVIFKHQTNS